MKEPLLLWKGCNLTNKSGKGVISPPTLNFRGFGGFLRSWSEQSSNLRKRWVGLEKPWEEKEKEKKEKKTKKKEKNKKKSGHVTPMTWLIYKGKREKDKSTLYKRCLVAGLGFFMSEVGFCCCYFLEWSVSLTTSMPMVHVFLEKV